MNHMEPHGWRNWKEVPYRGQPESKTYKSNKPIKYSRVEKLINIISVLFFGTLSLVAIFFTIKKYQAHDTSDMFPLIIASLAGIIFTIAITQGVISTTKRRRKSRVKKKKRDSKD